MDRPCPDGSGPPLSGSLYDPEIQEEGDYD
jgi:hypothetical protein